MPQVLGLLLLVPHLEARVSSISHIEPPPVTFGDLDAKPTPTEPADVLSNPDKWQHASQLVDNSTVGTVQAVGMLTEAEPGVQAAHRSLSSGFVRTKPGSTQFWLNDKPWYCAGTNAYYAAWLDLIGEGEVAYMLEVRMPCGER